MFSREMPNFISYTGGFGSVIQLSKIFKVEEAEKLVKEGVYTMSWFASKHEGAKHFRAVQYDYEPNWSTNVTHLHNMRESVYIILEGLAKVHLNGEIHELGAGMVVYLSPGDVHGVVGSGPDGLKMIEVWAPVDQDIVYFEDGKEVKK
jgi:quercetin dioxygenase-like cupin family protein